jgi:hypothetical protein
VLRAQPRAGPSPPGASSGSAPWTPAAALPATTAHALPTCPSQVPSPECAGVPDLSHGLRALQPVALLCRTARAEQVLELSLSPPSRCPHLSGAGGGHIVCSGVRKGGGRHCSLRRQCRLTLPPRTPHLTRACVRVCACGCVHVGEWMRIGVWVLCTRIVGACVHALEDRD